MIKIGSCNVSIIVPVYNVEKYLDKCLDSLCNQTINNKEIIIINDASTDKSLDIIMKYKEIYDDIVVINEKINGGQGRARNLAINIAKGDYIGFVDGDDFVEIDMFEKMYNEAVKKNLDIAICNFKLYFEKNNKIVNNISLKNCQIINKNEAIKKFLTEKTIEGFSWNKLIKRKIFEGIKYKEGVFYEDIPTILNLIINSNRIGFVNEYLYNYVQRSNSVTNSIKSKNLYHFILANIEVNKILELNNLYSIFIDEVKFYNLNILYQYDNYMVCKKHIVDEYVKKIGSFYKVKRKGLSIVYVIFNKSVSIKDKIRILAFKFNIPIYYYVKIRLINKLKIIFNI